MRQLIKNLNVLDVVAADNRAHRPSHRLRTSRPLHYLLNRGLSEILAAHELYVILACECDFDVDVDIGDDEDRMA